MGDLRKVLKESGRKPETYTFEVYGPNDEPYTVYATFNPRTPLDVEVWKATGPDGEEIDTNELDAMGHDLKALALDNLPGKSDGLGLDYDDIHGKSGIDY